MAKQSEEKPERAFRAQAIALLVMLPTIGFVVALVSLDSPRPSADPRGQPHIGVNGEFHGARSPRFEIGLDFFFRSSAGLKPPADFGAQFFKQLAFQIDGKRAFRRREKDAGHSSPACDEYRFSGPEQFRGLVPKFTDGADPHVVTVVTL